MGRVKRKAASKPRFRKKAFSELHARKLPKSLDAEKVNKVESSLDSSLREDLAECGLELREARKLHPDHVRALAAARRADGQVDRLSAARDILLTFVTRTPDFLTEQADRRLTVLLTTDITAIWWTRCKICGHFSLDHRYIGGCTHRTGSNRCECTERGHKDLPLEQLEALR